MKRLLVITTSWLLVICFASDQARAAIYETELAMLTRLLHTNIIPFWYPRILDDELGGYRLNHDSEGNYLGPIPKGIIPQARSLWFFSRLHTSGLGEAAHLEAAHHGFRFLRDALWDQEFGGFYWEVNPSGSRPTHDFKDLVGNAFGLYALGEYYIATGNREALALAQELFSLIDTHAWDEKNGGYIELFQRDWTDTPIDHQGGLERSRQYKTYSTHLHLMEAFTILYESAPTPLIRERLLELIRIQSNAVIRKTSGAGTERYLHDWTPVLTPPFNRVSYGHDIENAWLMIKACQSAGISIGPYRETIRSLMDYALEFGFDHVDGGFFESGEPRRSADKKEKHWWVTAEGMVAAMYLYVATEDPKYWDVFKKTLGFAVKKQVDWRNGGWYRRILPDGTVTGYKSGRWKTPYHSGRSVIESIEILRELVKSKMP